MPTDPTEGLSGSAKPRIGEPPIYMYMNGVLVTLMPTGKGGLVDSHGNVNFGFTDRYRIQLPDGKTLPAGSAISYHKGSQSFDIDLPNSRDWLKIGTNGDIYQHGPPGLFGTNRGVKNPPSLFWKNTSPVQVQGVGADQAWVGDKPPKTVPGKPPAAPTRPASSGGLNFQAYNRGGGAGGGGGGSSVNVSTGTGLGEFDPDSKVSINAYGYIAKLAKMEPDLKKLMSKYAKEDLGNPAVQARLEADIHDTKWWTSHTDAYRKAEIIKATDPATYNKSIGEAVPGVQQAARDYLVPMSAQSAHNWAEKLASGQVTDQDYLNYVKEQAKSLFPGMNAAIDAGVTTKQYVQPYADIAAQTLELPPEKVNFLDPKWSKALFQVDPKTGARTSMSLADWQTTLRTDKQYGWDKTQQAKSQGADLISNMQRTFGPA